MSGMKRTIRIGTRGSALALTQTRTVCASVEDAHEDVACEIVVIKTSGDWTPSDGEVRLSEVDGGKGLFAKEIEQALLRGDIDAAVHSMKDMDSQLPQGLVIHHMLPREDARDALLFANEINVLANDAQFNNPLDILPVGAVIGTASVRRAAMILSKRPDVKIVPFRGNVRTRIQKLRGEIDYDLEEKVDCTLLAIAGLNRLGIAHEADAILSVDDMLPSAGQGAVGVEILENNNDIIAVFSHISCEKTVFCVKAEREALRIFDGSCHTPIGAYATLHDGQMHLRVCVCSLDGAQSFYDEEIASVTNVETALAIGRIVGERLKMIIPADILKE